MVEEVLVFDVFGDYGCFRIPFTTTSVLTYPFPSKVTILGIIAAILGKEKDSYNDESFNNIKIGLRILNPINKKVFGINLIDTQKKMYMYIEKKGKKSKIKINPFIHTQIPFEVVKNPKYRIYVILNNNINKLEDFLKEHKSFFTPYLGIAPFICNFNYIGKYSIKNKKSDDDVFINTVIPKQYFKNIVQENQKEYQLVRSMPRQMNNNREVLEFCDYIYEASCQPLKIKKSEYYEIRKLNENILFM